MPLRDTNCKRIVLWLIVGLVLTLLGRPPAVGDRVAYDGIQFEITVVDGHGVGRCQVTYVQQNEEKERK